MTYDIFMFDDKSIQKMNKKELKTMLNYYNINYSIKNNKRQLHDDLKYNKKQSCFLDSVEIKFNNILYYIHNINKMPFTIKSFIFSSNNDTHERYSVSYKHDKNKYIAEYNKSSYTWGVYQFPKEYQIIKSNNNYSNLYYHIRNGIKYIEFRHLYFMCFYLKEILIKDIWTHMISMFTDKIYINYKLII